MSKQPGSYDTAFYDYVTATAAPSAAVVVPLVMRIVAATSVVDVGCGTGDWLAAFGAAGVDDVLGLDDERVAGSSLRIPSDCFQAADLRQPLAVSRRFDLAVSLEVAEHLPASCADEHITSLCALAPVILFSAAVPGQGGEEHVNEQWPAYWAERFAEHGYEPVDVVRAAVWDDARVAWFYRQNLLLYVASTHRERLVLDSLAELPTPPLPLVHPATWAMYQRWAERHLATPPSFTAHVRQLGPSLRRAVARRLTPRRG